MKTVYRTVSSARRTSSARSIRRGRTSAPAVGSFTGMLIKLGLASEKLSRSRARARCAR
jgi:hypothetical protein